MSYLMAKWSKATKRRVRSYNAYKARLKEYSRETGTPFKPVPYAVFSEKYNERAQKVESGERKTFGSIAFELIKKENRPEVLYNEYKKRLTKRSDYLINRGLTPYDAIPMSYSDFVQSYSEYYSDFKREIEEGKRKNMGDVIGTIVSHQVYRRSEEWYQESYRAIQEWNAENPDKAIDIPPNSVFYKMKIRTSDFKEGDKEEWGPWFDILRKKKRELLKNGFENKEANELISRTFYGSP